MILTYRIHEVAPYISWTYFFHAWGFQPRLAKSPEAMQLLEEANKILNQLDEDFHVRSVFRLCRANADGDDLLLDETRFPLLRQQYMKKAGDPLLCLSDFVRPLSSGIPDTVGIFCSSMDAGMEKMYTNDPYKHLLVQTLADRLAEAATEKMHEYVRKEAWGYVADESLDIHDILSEKFQGIRPAIGYPSLPDQSANFILDSLLNVKQIGVTLTENGAMLPHASVSGLMISHPAARYFSVGKIGNDQLTDYAVRRGLSIDIVRKFLAPNLD